MLFVFYGRQHYSQIISYAAFTLSGFDDQERNLTFVKTAFHVYKMKVLF